MDSKVLMMNRLLVSKSSVARLKSLFVRSFTTLVLMVLLLLTKFSKAKMLLTVTMLVTISSKTLLKLESLTLLK